MRDRSAGAFRAAFLATLLVAARPSYAQPKRSSPQPSVPAAATAAPAVGSATGSAAAAPDPVEEARELFSKGVALARKDLWRDAHAAFLGAWKRKQHPQIALNLGRAALKTGRFVEATEHLRYCLDRIPASDPDSRLATEWLAEARKSVAKLAVTVSAAGARVLVDGRFVGDSPLGQPVLVDPGSHVVEASLANKGARREIAAERGSDISVDMVLLQVPAATATSPGPVSPDRGSAGRKALLIGGAGATALGLAAGITFAVLESHQERRRDACVGDGGRGCWDSLESERVTSARLSLAGFLGGGLFAVATGGYWLFGGEEAKATVAVAPMLSGAAGGGLAVIGAW